MTAGMPSTADPRFGFGARLRRLEIDWVPALIGAVVIVVAITLITGRDVLGNLQQGATVAAFLVLTGIGQLFVISAGSGNIDLSVPYNMTLTAYICSQLMRGADGMLVPAILVAVAVGGLIGLLNFAVIRALSIPPLIATLAVGFVLQTAIQLVSSGGSGSPAPALVQFATGRIWGFSFLSILAIAIVVFVHFVLTRGRYGRNLLAVGQSPKAAALSGIRVDRTQATAYVLCGVLAAIAGLLLSGYTSGPSLDMAAAFQLGAIAVVVLGGTSINGGKSNAAGVWLAALLLTMLSTLVSLTGAAGGVQRLVEGLVIVGVMALMPSPKTQ